MMVSKVNDPKMALFQVYPLVICYIATENGYVYIVSLPIQTMIFHSYVKLPEGIKV